MNRGVLVVAVVFGLAGGRPNVLTAAPVFLSFDGTRSSGTGAVGSAAVTGELQSFALGTAYQSARNVILTSYPGAGFVALPELTSESLTGDVFVSGLVAQNQNLSESEQTALFDFVSDGGAALIFAELDTFLSASNSLVSPFGVVFGEESFANPVTATFTDTTHPISDGPFGSIGSFLEAFVTSVSDLGPNATSIATNLLGDTLAVIPRGALSAQSGPVVIFSDSSLFSDVSAGHFTFADNAMLFGNTIAFVVPEPGAAATALALIGLSVIGWRGRNARSTAA